MAGAGSALDSETVSIEEVREGLLRDYGFELVREQFAFYARFPVSRVAEIGQDELARIERRLPKEAIRTRSTTTFVITDQDFIELDSSRFLDSVQEHRPGAIQEAVRDALSGASGGRDTRLRRILNEMSQARQREALEKARGGRSGTQETKSRRGRVVAYRQAPEEGTKDVALLPTIRAAVLRGAQFDEDRGLRISKQDIQENVRYTRVSSYMTLVVDTSTYDEEVQNRVKSLTKSLLLDAYERRDSVALILVRGNRAQLASDFTTDVEVVRGRLTDATWGGLSPFASGITEGIRVFLNRLADTQDAIRIFALLTTGRANVALVQGGDTRRELTHLPAYFAQAELNPLVVDVTLRGSPFLREFAQASGGRYYHPPSVRYQQVALAQELLSSIGSGEKGRAAAVGRALLSQIRSRNADSPDSS